MLNRFLKEESGQTATEYILIIGVVAIVIGIFKDRIIEMVNKAAKTSSSKIDSALK